MIESEYPGMRDADVDLARFVNEELTSEWVQVFEAMCKPDHPVTPESLAEYKVFKEDLDAGLVMKEVEIDGEKVLQVANLVDVIKIISSCVGNRKFTVPILKDLLLDLRCPLHFHIKNPKPIEVDDE